MLLGVDYGKKRIGLALGKVIPKGAGFIDGSKKEDDIISEINTICKENEVEKIIVGLPFKKSGDPGELVPEIKDFAQKLSQATGLETTFEEEELTSAEAEHLLKEAGAKINKKDGKVDELAAVLILEQYINSNLKSQNAK